ncbi:E3 ubiquitin-protein ligase ATL6-like [Aristolochia californica]|uniref:E3 ubiquitin-protein ligase ATL6-like n=1 Tax=Aristolochia californica TaxID=171875 RepID=UPI0035D894A9
MAIVNHSRSVIWFFLLLVPFSTSQPPDSSPSDSSSFEISLSSGDDFILLAIFVFFAVYYISNFIQRSPPGAPLLFSQSWALSRLWISQRSTGVDPSVVDTLPTFQYSRVKDRRLGKSSLECAVCLNEFKAEETIRLLPRCNHIFHPVCIDAWLTNNSTCPVCRSDLLQGPDTGASAGHASGTVSEVNQRVAENEVAIAVEEDQTVTARQMGISKSTKRPTPTPEARGSQRRNSLGRLWRSNSTGHSMVQLGENFERFTLRLPEEISMDIMRVEVNTTSNLASPISFRH